MTYSSGESGYPGSYGSPSSPQSASPPSAPPSPSSESSKSGESSSPLPFILQAGVVVLGLIAFVLSLLLGDHGLPIGVVALLFSSLLAGVALLPKQDSRTGIVTVTAIVGFLLVIWDLVTGSGSTWVLIVITVVGALQAILAIAALLLEAGVINPPAPRAKHENPYQSYGGYYGPPAGPPGQYGGPPSGPPQGAPPNFGPPQGYSPYGSYPGAPSTGGFAAQGPQSGPQAGFQAGPPTPPTGFPAYGAPPAGPPASPQGDAPTQQVKMPQVPLDKPAAEPDEPSSESPSGPPPS